MYRSSAKRLSALVVSVVVGFFLVSSSALFGAEKIEKKTVGKSAIKTYFPTKMKISAPLRNHLKRPGPAGPTLKEGRDKPFSPVHAPANVARPQDPAVKTAIHAPLMPDPIADFEGVAQFESSCGCYPPDTNAAVGPDDVIQIVNTAFEIYDKTGASQTGGPVVNNALWTDFGGPCEDTNDGDPIVKYDQLSQRWVFTQFAVEQIPFLECFAVSVTNDPLGSYYQSSYDFGTNGNDYPKLSIMPDAYYLTIRQFENFSTFNGAGVVAFDRAAMVAGDPATAIYFDIGSVYPDTDTFLAADLQGTNPPNAGTAESIIGIGSPDYDGSPSSVLHFVQMTPNFTDPPSTVITNFDVDVDPFDYIANNVPQPDGYPDLETLPFPMYTPNYRNFGDYDALVFTHDVDAGGGRAGRRWYEVRAPLSDTPEIYQQGTFAPDDGLNRWMGSAALDYSGNIAMGYSVSSTEQYPSIWYTGRLVTDPLGEMSQGENIIIDGTGSQDGGAARWGDYSSMVTDPTDECTFWYTTEYIETTGLANWQTRVGSFKFPSCSIGPTGTIQGTVTDGSNPLSGVKVTAGSASTNTNASGAYSFTLPIGLYDMTASKYGYIPGAASGIDVTDGGNVVQNFVLATAPSVTVNGVVKDGSGGGWPLYAKVVIKATGAPTFTLYTDPVTGYYSQTLVSGIPYTFQVNAVAAGYLQGGGVVPLGVTTLAPSATVVNWDLLADLVSCNAQGYAYPAGTLFQGFETGALPAGWSTATPNGGGNWRFPLVSDQCGRTNKTGGTGGFAILDSDCDGIVEDDASLITPSIDFSGIPSPILQFNSDYIDLDSIADVDVSTDGGSNWTNVWQRAGADDPGPSLQSPDISGLAGGEADVQVRFRFQGFWAWWWEVDNVLLGDPAAVCAALPGGMVVGNVLSANNGSGLNGAMVENLTSGGSAKTFATPNDPSQPDGMYMLFSESGSNDLKASLSLYASDQHTTVVIPNSTVRQNFSLLSGSLSASPTPLNSKVNPGGTDQKTLNLTNTGGAAAGFEIIEINAPVLTNRTSGFASEALRQQALARFSKDASGRPDLARSAKGLAPLPGAPPAGKPMAAGDVVASYPTGITFGWGVATSGANFWLSNIGIAGGDDKDYQYDSSTGAQTGNVMDDAGIGEWAADGAFNSQTGMIWRVAVGGDNCIHELNPVTLSQTGNTICGSPWTGTSQRGLAYDAVNNAYFVGGWNEATVYHIDSDGNVMDSAFVNLPISGMAYDASNGHLLVMSNTDATDITVLDALNNYAVLGSYNVTDGGSRVLGNFEQAGIEFDCTGNLWAVNQATQVVYNVATGENAGCAVDIPWLSENPTEGTVPAAVGTGSSNPFPVSVSFDSGSLLPGLRQAQLQVKTDTPVSVPAVPVTLTVRFLDVPDSNPFQAFIYGAAGANVMMGGPPTCPAGVLDFCPSGVVTRADMAGYLFRAINGANTPPPVYQNIFGDVTFNQYNSFYIQGIYDAEITAGCGSGNYCPDAPNTRAQMSVFIYKGQHGSMPPPACTTQIFDDVPCDSFAADYINALYEEGVTAGCGGGNFCPSANITNGQMAVFLVKGFNIPYLP
jgi:hypothetical protein